VVLPVWWEVVKDSLQSIGSGGCREPRYLKTWDFRVVHPQSEGQPTGCPHFSSAVAPRESKSEMTPRSDTLPCRPTHVVWTSRHRPAPDMNYRSAHTAESWPRSKENTHPFCRPRESRERFSKETKIKGKCILSEKQQELQTTDRATTAAGRCPNTRHRL
jgi:hypothetical protein